MKFHGIARALQMWNTHGQDKIQAIKAIRELTGTSLRAAKDFVEELNDTEAVRNGIFSTKAAEAALTKERQAHKAERNEHEAQRAALNAQLNAAEDMIDTARACGNVETELLRELIEAQKVTIEILLELVVTTKETKLVAPALNLNTQGPDGLIATPFHPNGIPAHGRNST